MHGDLALHKCSAVELGRRMREGEIDAQELTEYFIERVMACADRAIFISTTFERARCEAGESARRYAAGAPAGPLDGVPVAWKDVFDVAGTVTTAGTPIFLKHMPAACDAPIVRRLSQAGMVILGKTNLSQFANSALGLNPYFGTPVSAAASGQPRVPGGSSSGSAVAVARGLAPLAIGTDTGGSIRTPAAFNGVVGFKTSVGRYPLAGVFPLARSLDTIGFIARCVEDCSALDAAATGIAPEAAAGAAAISDQASRYPLYVPENILAWADDEVRESLAALRSMLVDAGYRVVGMEIPQLETIHRVMKERGGISLAEAYWEHRRWVESDDAHWIDPFVRGRILGGKRMSACDLLALQRLKADCTQSVWSRVAPGALMMPTVPHVAPTFAQVSDATGFADINERTTCFTVLINMLNGCSLSLPCGSGRDGMPMAVSISLPAGDERRLLQLGTHIAGLCERAASRKNTVKMTNALH